MTDLVEPHGVPNLVEWRGHRVPYVVPYQRGQVGRPAFEAVDPVKWARCVEERLCGICGESLGYWLVFIGGPVSVENRLFMDPAMHPECADYALEACPYLLGSSEHASAETLERRAERDGIDRTTLDYASDEAPDRIAVYRTRRYQARRHLTYPHGRTAPPRVDVVLKAAPAKGIEWHDRNRGDE